MNTFRSSPSIPGCNPPPNSVIGGDDFYISYNDHDIDIYGRDTTALVLGQMQHFYILNGDHRLQYAKLVPQGLDACLAYFSEHVDQVNVRSEAAYASDPLSALRRV
jgi:hypothetical protein